MESGWLVRVGSRAAGAPPCRGYVGADAAAASFGSSSAGAVEEFWGRGVGVASSEPCGIAMAGTISESARRWSFTGDEGGRVAASDGPSLGPENFPVMRSPWSKVWAVDKTRQLLEPARQRRETVGTGMFRSCSALFRAGLTCRNNVDHPEHTDCSAVFRLGEAFTRCSGRGLRYDLIRISWNAESYIGAAGLISASARSPTPRAQPRVEASSRTTGEAKRPVAMRVELEARALDLAQPGDREDPVAATGTVKFGPRRSPLYMVVPPAVHRAPSAFGRLPRRAASLEE